MPKEEEIREERDFSLPKSSRITRNRDYRRIYQRGKRCSNRAGRLYVVKTRGETRMGFVTTKKIGHAFARNRARRLMKEVYRLNRARLTSHREIVLLAGPFLTTCTYREAEKAILALWRKAGILGDGA